MPTQHCTCWHHCKGGKDVSRRTFRQHTRWRALPELLTKLKEEKVAFEAGAYGCPLGKVGRRVGERYMRFREDKERERKAREEKRAKARERSRVISKEDEREKENDTKTRMNMPSPSPSTPLPTEISVSPSALLPPPTTDIPKINTFLAMASIVSTRLLQPIPVTAQVEDYVPVWVAQEA
ncbi:hypothetical protein BDQ17DRAFT_1376733, partial [Cyathus striatus]